MKKLFVLFSFVIFFTANKGFAAQSNISLEAEKVKINMLVEKLNGLDAVFIRNGSEHSADEAYTHIKRKIRSAGDRLKTARQFVDKLASKSYFTGKPYYIKLSNGRKVTTKRWLYENLYEIEYKLKISSLNTKRVKKS